MNVLAPLQEILSPIFYYKLCKLMCFYSALLALLAWTPTFLLVLLKGWWLPCEDVFQYKFTHRYIINQLELRSWTFSTWKKLDSVEPLKHYYYAAAEAEKEEMRKREDFLAYMELNNQNMMSWEDKVSFLTLTFHFCFILNHFCNF